jgi:hypothetical protein
MSATRARALFQKFFGRAPHKSELQTIQMPDPVDGVLIGAIKKIVYQPTGSDTYFEHEFAEGEEPQLFVSDDGEQFLPLGGVYEFTPRGFVEPGEE